MTWPVEGLLKCDQHHFKSVQWSWSLFFGYRIFVVLNVFKNDNDNYKYLMGRQSCHPGQHQHFIS